MRIPLIRKGGDETPIAWWEHLFLPLLLLLFGLAAVISIPVTYYWRWSTIRRERQLRDQMASQGRLIDWQQVSSGLSDASGTLLIEHFSFKGWPFRLWWTEEDVIADAPLAIPDSVNYVIDSPEDELLSIEEFARLCSSKYFDHQTGSAKLTDISDDIPYDRKLREVFPRGKIVVVLQGDKPWMWVGDGISL